MLLVTLCQEPQHTHTHQKLGTEPRTAGPTSKLLLKGQAKPTRPSLESPVVVLIGVSSVLPAGELSREQEDRTQELHSKQQSRLLLDLAVPVIRAPTTIVATHLSTPHYPTAEPGEGAQMLPFEGREAWSCCLIGAGEGLRGTPVIGLAPPLPS